MLLDLLFQIVYTTVKLIQWWEGGGGGLWPALVAIKPVSTQVHKIISLLKSIQVDLKFSKHPFLENCGEFF